MNKKCVIKALIKKEHKYDFDWENYNYFIIDFINLEEMIIGVCGYDDFSKNKYFRVLQKNFIKLEKELCENCDEEDMDLHRLYCKKCGKVRYYNEIARDHYENKIINDMKGLIL